MADEEKSKSILAEQSIIRLMAWLKALQDQTRNDPFKRLKAVGTLVAIAGAICGGVGYCLSLLSLWEVLAMIGSGALWFYFRAGRDTPSIHKSIMLLGCVILSIIETTIAIQFAIQSPSSATIEMSAMSLGFLGLLCLNGLTHAFAYLRAATDVLSKLLLSETTGAIQRIHDWQMEMSAQICEMSNQQLASAKALTEFGISQAEVGRATADVVSALYAERETKKGEPQSNGSPKRSKRNP